VADQVRVAGAVRALHRAMGDAAGAPETVHLASMLNRLATQLRIAEASGAQARRRLVARQRALPRAMRRLRVRIPGIARAEARRRLRVLVHWADLGSEELRVLLRGAARRRGRTVPLDVNMLLLNHGRTQRTQAQIAKAVGALGDVLAPTR
jgi:hypothetical protein